MIGNQFFKFGIISVFTNGSGFLLALALNALGFVPVLCSSTSYVYSLVISYLLQAKYTFRAEIVAISSQTGKFLITHVIGFILNATIIYVLTSRNEVDFFSSQLISTLVCGATIFMLNKFWVFRSETRN